MAGLRILVSGAGIAGSTVAYWLGKGGAQVTVTERAPALRAAGQGIDIEGPAIDVIRRMGLEDQARRKHTGEKGLAFVYDDGSPIATFDTEDKDNDIGFTSEIEIMRGDLTELLYQVANAMDNVEFRYSCSIDSLSETSTSDGNNVVTVTFTGKDHKAEDFDIVIAADGLGSRTRDMILRPDDRKACFFSLGGYVSYFSIPRQDQDAPRSRFYNATGRRSVLIRPRDQSISSAYLNIIQETPELAQAAAAGTDAQKALLAKLFEGVLWTEVPRVLRDMQNAEDFYFQRVAQIRLTNGWSRGCCVLVGDAAYCPSPFSGQGTPLAIQGAYILAGEICSNPRDLSSAFKSYEEKLKPYVKTAQRLSLDGLVPRLLNPDSAWGIWVLRTVLRIIANSGILRLGSVVRGLIGRGAEIKVTVPDYDFGGEIARE